MIMINEHNNDNRPTPELWPPFWSAGCQRAQAIRADQWPEV